MQRKNARQNSETWKKCNMMMMNCFWVTVDRRKGISLISNQHNCQRFSPFANLQYPASRIWTCAEPGYRSCWMKLYITNNHYAGVPQTRKLQRNAISKEWYLKNVQLEKKYNIKKSVTCKEFNIILVQDKTAQHKNRATSSAHNI